MRVRNGDVADDDLRRRLSMFTSCRASQNCKCRGFRPKHAEAEAEEGENELFALGAEIIGNANNEDKCRRCSHSLKDHFSSSLGKCDKKELEMLDHMAQDAVYLQRLLKDTEDPDLLQVYWQAFNIIIRSLSKHSPPEEGPWAPLPHETLPVKYLLTNYLATFNRLYDMPEQISFVEQLLSTFNLWEIPTPSEYKNIVTDVEVAQYRIVYFHWLQNVILPKSCKSMDIREPVEIFGPRALLHFIRFATEGRVQSSEELRSTDLNYVDFLKVIAQLCHEAISDGRQVKLPLPGDLSCLSYSKVPGSQSIEDKPSIEFLPPKAKRRKTDQIHQTGEVRAIADDMMLKCVVKIVEQENEAKQRNLSDTMNLDVARGETARREEELNIIEFRLVHNNLDSFQDQCTFAWLAQLVTLFSVQLPKMPKEYISRFVYDKHHTNLALIKEGRVIGGICFRSFATQRFIEIVFCAITASEQVKGYGTHLMNHLKDLQVKRKCVYMLTFADQFATGYFSKQGFSGKIDLPKNVYHGFIKEYEGATLMGCQLHPQMSYVDFYPFIKNTRDLHRALSGIKNPNQNRKFGGIEHLFRQKGSDIIKVANIPGLEHLAKGYVPFEKDDEIDGKMKLILKKLKESENSWPFLKPVDRDEVPEYYSFIEYPIDLQTMAERLKSRYYVHERLFIADLMRMFNNCYLFNGRETPYYSCGYAMNKLAFKLCFENFPDSDLINHLQDLPPGAPEL